MYEKEFCGLNVALIVAALQKDQSTVWLILTRLLISALE